MSSPGAILWLALAPPKKVEDLRQRVLAASVRLIAEHGLSALSFREVARQAGVSHQAPYHHFADREAILAAIAEEGFRRLADGLEAAHGKTAIERFSDSGRAYVAFATANPAHFQVMFRPELVDVAAYPDADAQAKRAYAALEALVQAVIADGVLPARKAPGLTVLAWGLAHGLASLYIDGPLAKTGPDGVEPEQQLEAAFGTFRELIAGAAKPRARRRRTQ